MDARLSKLETHMEYVSRDLAVIRSSQKETSRILSGISSALEKLPTKDDLWSWKLQWLAIALGTVAFIVGGIIGGLDWIKDH
jgi:hypothetical protein